MPGDLPTVPSRISLVNKRSTWQHSSIYLRPARAWTPRCKWSRHILNQLIIWNLQRYPGTCPRSHGTQGLLKGQESTCEWDKNFIPTSAQPATDPAVGGRRAIACRVSPVSTTPTCGIKSKKQRDCTAILRLPK